MRKLSYFIIMSEFKIDTNRLKILSKDFIGIQKNSCLKFSFQFQTVNVRCFYSLDSDLESFQIILFKDELYYLKPINLGKISLYLDGIPPDLLDCIKDEKGKLDSFYKKLFEIINNGQPELSNYDDGDYTRTVKSTNCKILPFFKGLRKVNMTEKQFEIIHSSLGIDKGILYKIKKLGYTVVTTSEKKEEKNFYSELNRYDIT